MKKTFLIKGMHCNSCSQLIEEKLKDKVNSVSASYSKETAEVDFDENKISEKEIKQEIEKLGYTINQPEEKNTKENKNSGSDKIGLYFLIGSIILALVVLYYLFGSSINIENFQMPEIGTNTSLILLFLTGILTGFHCISMCGGFVVSYTAKNAIKGHKSFKQHLVYGSGKLVSYALIGGIFGLIGGIFAFSAGLRGWVAILAGIFMIFYALSMFGFKFFKRFQFNPKFLTKLSAKASANAKGPYLAPLVTGLLSGLFIACGPLQAMYLFAAGTGSFVTGFFSLTVFGLGTLPIMLGFGSLTTVISHKTTAKILKLSAIIVLVLGIIMLNRGLALTGSSFSYDSIKAKFSSGSASAATINNGIQEINMIVDASGYSPSSFVLQKGVPVKWNINVKQLTGCNNEILVRDYKIDKKLKQGLNVIEFTPDKKGTISFSCWMGMIRGSFIVTSTGQASQEQVAAATPQSSGGSCGCGGGGGSTCSA